METLHILDSMLRAGEVSRAREALRALSPRGIARAYRADVAELFRRAGLAEIGARLLHRAVRPERAGLPAATGKEKATYASCLAALGASREALALFAEVDRGDVPRADLLLAQALIRQWDYSGAARALRAFLAVEPAESYDALVARLNLAACHVYLGVTGQEDLLERAKADCRRRGYRRLYGQAVHIAAMRALSGQDAGAARAALAELDALSARWTPLDRLVARKWNALAGALAGASGDETAAELHRIGRDARALRDWETVRDCDRHLAAGGRDPERWLKVYFGTPFTGYRDHLGPATGPQLLPETFDWRLGRGGKGDVFSLVPDAIAERGLRAGAAQHRLLLGLASDFYRPLDVATLFAAMQPAQTFNPFSSIHRVHVAVGRLRSWLAAREIPLAIERQGGGYRLAAPGGALVVRVPRHKPDSVQDELVAALGGHFAARLFTTAEAAQVLAVPERSLRRRLSTAAAEGKLHRSGSGPTTAYRVPSRGTSAAG